MTFALVRSIRLGRTTTRAWKSAGGVFIPRGLSTWEKMRYASRIGAEFIVNLGNTRFNPTEYGRQDGNGIPVIGYGNNVQALVTPGATRRDLWAYMPPRPVEFPATVWVKTPGFGGRGKYKEFVTEPLVLPSTWDWQEHVDGQEYRLVTVGDKIVQDFERFGDNGEREYHWIRMSEVSSDLKAIVRAAAASLPGTNVVAWDAIVTQEGRPYIFEGNTCPGMSERTAERIVRQIREQLA